jgi:hypothetical protein
MQVHHEAAHARPTADSINRFAAGLLAAAPGMHPLDAVRLAMEAAEGATTHDRVEHPPSSGGQPPPRGRGNAP